MTSMSADEALAWAAGNDGAPYSFSQIIIAQSGLANNPPGTEQYALHEQSLNNAIADVEQARAEQATADQGFDPAFGSAQCDCEPNQPCCLRALEVSDAAHAARKVIWPIEEGQPKRLYVISKDPYAGAPSAKVNVTLTDKETCQCGATDRPAAIADGFIAGPEHVMESTEQTVISPFQMPAFNSAMLPRDVMVGIYIVGMLLQAKTFRDARPATVQPYQCCLTDSNALEVFPIPHANLSVTATGTVFATLGAVRGFSWGGGVTGEVTGEFGNQTLTWASQTTHTIASPQAEPQGPINHPVFDMIDKM